MSGVAILLSRSIIKKFFTGSEETANTSHGRMSSVSYTHLFVLLDTPQKGAANPWSVIVTPDDKQIIVAAAGSQELVRIDRIALHERLAKAKQGEMVTPSVKSWNNIPNDAGFLYGIRDFIPTQGKGPRSVVATGDKIYTANYYTRCV